MRVQRKGRGCKRIRGELLAGEHPAVQERRNGWSRTSGPTGKEAFGVSLWDNEESAEAYNRGSYVDVTRILSKVVEGTAQVDTYEVSNSTFHKIGAAATV